MNLLEVSKLHKRFGGAHIINGLDFEVREGEILGIIGPNGSGKTTVFNLISGVYKPNSGKITFRGEEITGLSPNKIVSKGLARTFQLTTLFPSMSVLDNILVGCHWRSGLGFIKSIVKTSSAHQAEESMMDRAKYIMSFVGMADFSDTLAEELSAGHQKMLALALALGPAPDLVLIDEPLTSLDMEEVQAMSNLIRQIRDDGRTIVLVEHNMKVIFNLCDRIMVLNNGVKLAEGTPAEVRDNEAVIRAYLGGKKDVA